ncbi:MAG: aminotransferase class IV [Minisyncoccales bacterium]
MFHYLNGKLIKEKEPKIYAFDLGFLRGYGLFDYLRTYGPYPFLLKEHLLAFFKRAKLCHLKIPLSLSQVEKVIFKLIKKNYSGKDLGFRLIVTGGPDPFYTQKRKKNSFFILTNLIPQYPKSFYQKGIKLLSLVQERAVPFLKSLSSYFNSYQAYQQAKRKKFDDVLFLDKDKRILECFNSNFFAIKKNELLTPSLSEKIFGGATRNFVLNLARENGLRIKERVIFFKEIKTFSEAFLTSTSKEIMPVAKINNLKMKAPGSFTIFLSSLFKKEVEKFKCSKTLP